jgi:uncharacterized protein YoaH (UPF0181 family)
MKSTNKAHPFFLAAQKSGAINTHIHKRLAASSTETLSGLVRSFATSLVISTCAASAFSATKADNGPLPPLPLPFDSVRQTSIITPVQSAPVVTPAKANDYEKRLEEIKSKQRRAELKKEKVTKEPSSLTPQAQAINAMVSMSKDILKSLSELCDLTPASNSEPATTRCSTGKAEKIEQPTFKIGESHGLAVYIDDSRGEGFGIFSVAGEFSHLPDQSVISLNPGFVDSVLRLPCDADTQKSVIEFSLDRASFMSNLATNNSDLLRESLSQLSQSVDAQAIDNLMDEGYSADEAIDIVAYAYAAEQIYIEKAGNMDKVQEDELMSFFSGKFEKSREFAHDKQANETRQRSKPSMGSN